MKELVEDKILNCIGTIKTSATTEKFVAKDFFTINNKEVKICDVWENFTEWFLSGDGKTENPIEEQELRYGNLTKSSVDGPIIKELGGKAKAETTLQVLADLMKKHARGEKSGLLINVGSNIFYIQDVIGVLRAVCVDWSGGSWNVLANSVEFRSVWSTGGCVFSRNS